jgi:CheY-like chemotaxis protein
VTVQFELEPHLILIADDEPDIASVTRLGLKGLNFQGRSVRFLTASSGAETLEIMAANPGIAVVLLDVVMESEHAGLEACQRIRDDLGNHLVRILLRTGQPGKAPEKETIEQYDIDGYLPKAEVSTNRLYAAVRTAIKTYEELESLDRHRRYLSALHKGMASLHAFDPLEPTLERILETTLEICPTGLAMLQLDIFTEDGEPRVCSVELCSEADYEQAESRAAAIRVRFSSNASIIDHLTEPTPFEDGYLIPLVLPRDLGNGWIFLEGVQPDELTAQILPLLATNAANALYAVIAQELLAQRRDAEFEAMIV